MRIQRFQTAVLLFSLPAPLAAYHKRLAKGRSERQILTRSRSLWSCMHQLAQAKIQAAQLAYIQSKDVLHPSDFCRPFSVQLHKAICATLSLGYKRVIIIGNDCPGLTVNDFHNAEKAFKRGSLPVGYDQRGGVFLFGVDKRFLQSTISESFTQLPWRTNQLGEALTEFLENNFGTVCQLTAVRADWNNRSDLHVGITPQGAFRWLTERIQLLINRYSQATFKTVAYRFFYRIAHSLGLRAPPAY